MLLLVVGRLVRPSRSTGGFTTGMASAFFNSSTVGVFIVFPCSIAAVISVAGLHVLKRDGVAVVHLFDISDQHADLTASIVDQPRPLADGVRDGAHCAASFDSLIFASKSSDNLPKPAANFFCFSVKQPIFDIASFNSIATRIWFAIFSLRA